jgi:hypothetical protein
VTESGSTGCLSTQEEGKYVGYRGMFVGISAARATERGVGGRVAAEPKGLERSKNSPFSGPTVGDVQVDGYK